MKIPIKKYVFDPSLSWEENYKRLEAHHIEETKWLIEESKKNQSIYEQNKELKNRINESATVDVWTMLAMTLIVIFMAAIWAF